MHMHQYYLNLDLLQITWIELNLFTIRKSKYRLTPNDMEQVKYKYVISVQ
jgi:hypothetical protein